MQTQPCKLLIAGSNKTMLASTTKAKPNGLWFQMRTTGHLLHWLGLPTAPQTFVDRQQYDSVGQAYPAKADYSCSAGAIAVFAACCHDT